MSSAAKSSPKTEKLEVGEGASDARPNPMLLITAKAKKAHSTTSTERIPAPTSLLEKVKTFLPRMEQEQKALQERIGNGEDVTVDNPTDGEERVIEMNVGILPGGDNNESGDWTEDSEPDSPESPPRPGDENDFTSDSDSDSTNSSSSDSESSGEGGDGKKKKKANATSKAKNSSSSRKRALVQEVGDGSSQAAENKASKVAAD